MPRGVFFLDPFVQKSKYWSKDQEKKIPAKIRKIKQKENNLHQWVSRVVL